MRCCGCKADKDAESFDLAKNGLRLKGMCRDCCDGCGDAARKKARQARERNEKGEDYSSRNANLKRLGFESYRDYLASELWRQVRALVYAKKGRQCHLCGAPATELHHNRYHACDLLGRCLKYINPVCRGCHKGIEFEGGRKTTLREAAKGFRRKLRGSG